MPEIHIAVENGVASQRDTAVYICGSGDFTAVFAFEAGWPVEDLKTARFQTESTYQDVLFRGNVCPVPVFTNARKLEVGVYCGNLRTTTPARIAIREGIRSAWGPPEDPVPSLYDQILEAVGETDLRLEEVTDGVVLTVCFRGGERKAFLRHSEIYVGSGTMPEGYRVQVDPTGENPQLFVRAGDGSIVPVPAIQGPKGEKGDKGDKGDPGPQGPRGDVGADVVRSVAGQLPDEAGGVALQARHIGALPASGGTMTGNIDLGGNALTNVKSPAAATDAATKGYVDGKRLVLTTTIPASWTGSAEPYTQTISVPGILATDTPHIMPVYTDPNYSVTLAQIEGWSKIVSAFSGDGVIAFYCRPDKPAVAIPIQIEVMR